MNETDKVEFVIEVSAAHTIIIAMVQGWSSRRQECIVKFKGKGSELEESLEELQKHLVTDEKGKT